jgi:hypothetical protein
MYRYKGSREQIFLTLKDTDADATLTAVPGGVYNISPEPPAQFFEVVKKSKKAEPDPDEARMSDESGIDHSDGE